MQVGSIGVDGEASDADGVAGPSGLWADDSSEWNWSEDLMLSRPKKEVGKEDTGITPKAKEKEKETRKEEKEKERKAREKDQQLVVDMRGKPLRFRLPKGQVKKERKQTAYGLQEDDSEWDFWGQGSESVIQLSWLKAVEHKTPNAEVKIERNQEFPKLP